MSDGELHMGSALFLRSFKDHPSDSLTLTFPAPKQKGCYHLAIWLGVWKEGDATAAERLNAMGWYYNPDKAAQAIETRRAETQSGSVHESAVHAPKPNQEPTNAN